VFKKEGRINEIDKLIEEKIKSEDEDV